MSNEAIIHTNAPVIPTQTASTVVMPGVHSAPGIAAGSPILGNTPDFPVPSGLLKPPPPPPEPKFIEPNIVDMLAFAMAAGLATDPRGAVSHKDVYATANRIYQSRAKFLPKIKDNEELLFDQHALSITQGWAARGTIVADEIWATAVQHIQARRRMFPSQ